MEQDLGFVFRPYGGAGPNLIFSNVCLLSCPGRAQHTQDMVTSVLLLCKCAGPGSLLWKTDLILSPITKGQSSDKLGVRQT